MPGVSDGQSGMLEARYANDFQVGHNEFEFIFDFGQFHARDTGATAEAPPVRIVRIVMAPPFARALLVTLHRAIDEHEQLHGPIEQG